MIDFELSYKNRLNLNKDAGGLNHAFGDGYFIVDEYGREVNAFINEKEFGRLIEKFKYRQFLTEKLKNVYNVKIEFREDNVLFMNGKPIKDSYWNLPKNENEVDLFLDYISSKITGMEI